MRTIDEARVVVEQRAQSLRRRRRIAFATPMLALLVLTTGAIAIVRSGPRSTAEVSVGSTSDGRTVGSSGKAQVSSTEPSVASGSDVSSPPTASTLDETVTTTGPTSLPGISSPTTGATIPTTSVPTTSPPETVPITIPPAPTTTSRSTTTTTPIRYCGPDDLTIALAPPGPAQSTASGTEIGISVFTDRANTPACRMPATLTETVGIVDGDGHPVYSASISAAVMGGERVYAAGVQLTANSQISWDTSCAVNRFNWSITLCVPAPPGPYAVTFQYDFKVSDPLSLTLT